MERDYYPENEPSFPAQEPAPHRNKKKITFRRVVRGFAKWLAAMPAKTLLLFGGSLMLTLIAIIVLVSVLSNSKKPENDLSVSTAVTPSPTIGVTFTPEPSAEPTVTPDPDPLGGVQISLNMFHEKVEEIQTRLIELGYMTESSSYAVNDAGYRKYGPSTKNAVKRFQLRNQAKLTEMGSLSAYPDGVVGAVTYNLLMSDAATSFYMRPGDEDNGENGLWSDSNNPLVTNLQKKLAELGYLTNGQVTGKYGEVTYKAVEAFQYYNSLTTHDGYAGQETLKFLESGKALNAVDGKVAFEALKASGATSPSPAVSHTPVPDDLASTNNTIGD